MARPLSPVTRPQAWRQPAACAGHSRPPAARTAAAGDRLGTGTRLRSCIAGNPHAEATAGPSSRQAPLTQPHACPSPPEPTFGPRRLCHPGTLMWSPVSTSKDTGAGQPTGTRAKRPGTRPGSEPAAPAWTLGPRGRGGSAPGCCDEAPRPGALNDGDMFSHESEAVVSAARGATGGHSVPGVSPAFWGVAGTSVVLRLVDASPRLLPPAPTCRSPCVRVPFSENSGRTGSELLVPPPVTSLQPGDLRKRLSPRSEVPEATRASTGEGREVETHHHRPPRSSEHPEARLCGHGARRRQAASARDSPPCPASPRDPSAELGVFRRTQVTYLLNK